MSKKGDYTVIHRDNGWAAIGNGNSRASSLHGTQAGAYTAARNYSAHNGGGDVSVHGLDGKIREKNTIAPAHDPRNIKG